ncbi:PH domain-containing protein [Rhabdothermincola salaria]|uniref:PH domain-containing protein n=1 Tax=Rhabdothermincola salaria TaxID=2903142 RepID=UPI001E2DB042|nr:PH domain-containing protein [Rhabdothermincola salaria]MCD9622789.1 PH domain-containing protein [Rhabdothermincola salaria]
MIVVDAVVVLASTAALFVLNSLTGADQGPPTLVVVVVVGAVIGALFDAYRWVVTRYRVTDEVVERRSGVVQRSHRSVRRDRIRTVDVHAKVRHRLAGLRVVSIGAGQQSSAGEAAFDLDAVSVADAQALRTLLLHRTTPEANPAAPPAPSHALPSHALPSHALPSDAPPTAATIPRRDGRPVDGIAPVDALPDGGASNRSVPHDGAPNHGAPSDGAPRVAGVGPVADTAAASAPHLSTRPTRNPPDTRVLARLQPRWALYNVFSPWAFVMALGLVWGAFWAASTVGVDARGVVGGLADWEAIGPVWTTIAAVAAIAVIGVVGLAVNFFVEHGHFELARVPSDDTDGTVLRTRQGLLTTREVTRDDHRLRGVQIAEPLSLRWLGATDASVITTGLDMGATSQPAAVLPRTPFPVARRVAGEVLGVEPSPLVAPLVGHPRAALRRRVTWATLATAAVVGVLGWLVVTGVVPSFTLAAGAVVWPLALTGAVIAYRALGHAISGDYVVVRSGLDSRTTSALQRSAVSTVAVRESVLQRRLGLRTVTFMTSAGAGAYAAPDLDAGEAVGFAERAAPGVLTAFLAPAETPPTQPAQPRGASSTAAPG